MTSSLGLRRLVCATAVTLVAAIAAVGMTPAAASASAGSLVVLTCGAGVFGEASSFGVDTSIYCPPGTSVPPGMTILTGPNTVPSGQRAQWEADAPAGLVITGAAVGTGQIYSIGLNDGPGWGGGFYWAGGGAQTNDGISQYSVSGLDTSYLGFQVVCGRSTCDGVSSPAQLTVESMALFAPRPRAQA